MILIQKDKKDKKKATNGCKNPYQYAKKVYEKDETTENSEESGSQTEYEVVNATAGCKNDEQTGEAEQRKKKKSEPDALASALRILQSGANSSRMLREKLQKKGFGPDQIRVALDEVKKQGFVNDRRLLFSHAEFLARRKYYGRFRIRMELLQKFDAVYVTEFFEEAVAQIDFQGYAEALVRKNRGKTREAIVGKLKRNGYTASEIREALSTVSWDESQEDEF